MTSVSELGYDNLDYNEIVFPKLGFDFHIDSTAFTIFGLDIQWYGIIITCGLVLALIFGLRNMRRVGIDPDRAIDAVIGGIIGGIIGARIYYVAFNWSEYAGDWKEIFNTRGGGLAIYGGVIGAFLVGSIVCKFRKVKLLPMLDICGTGFLLGQAIGRWGNFTNQEAFGRNTDSIFGMSGGRIQTWISRNYTSDVLNPDYMVHPCFLYESVWCLTGFIILAIFLKKYRKFDGQNFLFYLIWYGLGRFFIEGLRTDSLMIGTLRVSQVLAALCVVVCVILMIIFSSKVKRMGREYQLYCNTEESRLLLAQADALNQKAKNKSEISEKHESEDNNNG
ncbi:MAG: prolipoprotein diacylglyceryl transferase [Oscillospiraceae bacterium]|nr:prolipoprotein diacylglyceryl transferase [Oscillospiraceae bacterium]